MFNTISQYLQALNAPTDRYNLQFVLNAIGDRMGSQALSSAGFVIKAGASPLVKTGTAATYAIANQRLLTIAGSTDMPALVGTVVNATFNVFVFYVDQTNTRTSAMGAAASTLAAVRFPSTPQGSAILGFIVVNPTGTGNFVGGTTALDDATVVPNVAYINTQGAFDPTIALS